MEGSNRLNNISNKQPESARPARGGILMHFIRARRGAVAIEFALGLPIFLAMVYGVFEFVRIFWTQNTMEFAVQEAARYTIVNPKASNVEIAAIVQEKAAGLDVSRITVKVVFEADSTGTGSVGANGFVNITGIYKYTPVIPLVLPVAGSSGIDFTKLTMDIVTTTRTALVLQ